MTLQYSPFLKSPYPFYFECILSPMNGFNSQIGANDVEINIFSIFMFDNHFKLFYSILVLKNINLNVKTDFAILKFINGI